MRRWALAASLVVLALGVVVQSALAAPPPTLTGQSFGAGTFGIAVDCRHNPDGTKTIAYRASASTDGPYPGSYVETGELVLRGPEQPDPYQEVVSFKGEFTIDSGVGQVSGALALSGPQRAQAGICEERLYDISLALTYRATITTPSGVFADRGSSGLSLQQEHANTPIFDFQEGFASGLTSAEQQGSVLFGKRTPGGSRSQMSANAKRASPFTLYFPAKVSKIHAYVDGKGASSGSQVLRGVLYGRAPDGGPGARLGQTFQFTIPAGMSDRWVVLYLAPPVQLQPGVYWLALHTGATGGVARFAWDAKDDSRRFNIDGYPDGPSNPFGSAPTDNQQMSIFASGSY